MRRILGIDIGGTRIRMGLAAKDGSLLDPRAYMVNDIGGDFIEGLTRIAADYLNEHSGSDICATAAGVPSTLSRDRSIVLSTPNIPGLNNVPLKAILEERFGIPAFTERDVNFLIKYDCMQLKVPAEGTVMACYYGTGIGNAVQIDGRLLIGRSGAACELGHIPLAGNDEPCGCGNRGCAETIAGGKYLAALCERLFPGEDISYVFEKHADSPDIIRFIKNMALPAAAEINILDPDAIIIGGGIPAMKAFPRGLFESELLSRVRRPYPAEGLNILYSDGNAFAGVIGGGLYGFDRLG